MQRSLREEALTFAGEEKRSPLAQKEQNRQRNENGNKNQDYKKLAKYYLTIIP